ncbi:toll/interleukin-1 receptor domain-containing protein [Acidovorax sp. NCPPB 4044]|uniref:toll/interleukin-1 receptor domain-containing protein n=1 Tax=Acidovorax sp. NCPPB 4044 TaxID=2940490 RepID=UPI0023033FA9|nr:toll/interleukin-1 receptor domain-containing protein [Acidovorax sp. NCPPB 4044]MDA8522181.1 toll/interleukin-1 receptor domain-containing protein [Acidovorax sp. NCPPB 4044]
MKIFISWSGPQSMDIGHALRDWLPCVLQYAKPYFTPNDIEKGVRWNAEIVRELEESKIGLLCLTHDNLKAPWLMFEAGAISKLPSSRLCPILFRVDQVQVTGPLSQFQNTQYSKTEIHKLIKNINNEAESYSLSETQLDTSFETWWPQLDKKITEIFETSKATTPPARSQIEIAEETLSIIRSLANRESIHNEEDDNSHWALSWDMIVEHGNNVFEYSKQDENPAQISVLKATISHMRKLFNLITPKLVKKPSYLRRATNGANTLKLLETRILQLDKIKSGDEDTPF